MLIGTLAQRFSQGRHADREVVLLDELLRPHRIQHLFFFDELPAVPNQQQQDVENLVSQRHRPTIPQQQAFRRDETKPIELVNGTSVLVRQLRNILQIF
jgi:hypothetical protein